MDRSVPAEDRQPSPVDVEDPTGILRRAFCCDGPDDSIPFDGGWRGGWTGASENARLNHQLDPDFYPPPEPEPERHPSPLSWLGMA